MYWKDRQFVCSCNCAVALSPGKLIVGILSLTTCFALLTWSVSLRGLTPDDIAAATRDTLSSLHINVRGARNHSSSSTTQAVKFSRLSQVYKDRKLHDFYPHYLCGENPITQKDVDKLTLAIVAISYRAPLSLGNALRSWEKNGLHDIADEKVLFLNAPQPKDFELGEKYGYRIMTTKEHHGNIMAGPALAYAVGNLTSDIVLFMEKDFVLTADKETTMKEMYAGIEHIAHGVDAYR